MCKWVAEVVVLTQVMQCLRFDLCAFLVKTLQGLGMLGMSVVL